MRHGQAKPDGQKEPWNFDVFVEAYNARAMELGGWQYEENPRTRTLEARYTASEYVTTVRDYAAVVFDVEQRM